MYQCNRPVVIKGKNKKLQTTAMDTTVLSLDFCKTSLKWRPNNLYKTLKFKPFKLFPIYLRPFSSLFPPSLRLKSYQLHANPQENSVKHTTLLVETFHVNQRLKALLVKLRKKDSSPLQILKDDGDWSKDQFWAAARFLIETSRPKEALQVFDFWKNVEKSRISEINYEKIIQLLVEVGLMDDAASTLRDMKINGLSPSLEIYNSIIHGYARRGEFEDALFNLKEMEELKLNPETKTYNGLIQAYGNYRMYDDMGKCVKRMESKGCFSDYITYNLLIVEFAQGGLLKRMERVYRTLLSKRMVLQSSTLVAMLEGYANLGILEKMEKVYRKVVNAKAPLKEGLVRKLARVYIESYMFSRLEDLGFDMVSRTGRTDLVWCLRLLSHACLLSRKGMNSVVQEMHVAKSSWNITITNIMALAYLKMKDFRELDILLSEIQTQSVKPDIVTIGVFFDASDVGFHGSRALNVWRRMGFLEEAVEMDTDPLVLTAFGKGHFLRNCEEMYSSLGPKAREKRVWTYSDLVDNVLKYRGRKSQFLGS